MACLSPIRRQQYIGKVNHAVFDSTGKKIVVSTEENVLALLHAGTGMIYIYINVFKLKLNQLCMFYHRKN